MLFSKSAWFCDFRKGWCISSDKNTCPMVQWSQILVSSQWCNFNIMWVSASGCVYVFAWETEQESAGVWDNVRPPPVKSENSSGLTHLFTDVWKYYCLCEKKCLKWHQATSLKGGVTKNWAYQISVAAPHLCRKLEAQNYISHYYHNTPESVESSKLNWVKMKWTLWNKKDNISDSAASIVIIK